MSFPKDVTVQDFVDAIEAEAKRPFDAQRRLRDCIKLRMLLVCAQGKRHTRCICTADGDIAFGCVFDADSLSPPQACCIAVALRRANPNATGLDCDKFVTPHECNYGESR